jgi:hypothetical protein
MQRKPPGVEPARQHEADAGDAHAASSLSACCVQRLHTVRYEDERSLSLDLRKRTWRLLPDLLPAPAAKRLTENQVTLQLQAPSQRPLWRTEGSFVTCTWFVPDMHACPALHLPLGCQCSFDGLRS